MNGAVVRCEGCDHEWRVDEQNRNYECPVCRWVGPTQFGWRKDEFRLARDLWWHQKNGTAPFITRRLVGVEVRNTPFTATGKLPDWARG